MFAELIQKTKNILREERGQTSTELILVLALVTGVTIVVFVFIKGFTVEEVGGRVEDEIEAGN
ncbi:MAG TPA: hypothetical protein VFF13_00510 [archaeon]|nr:hypothetical protein [archaeon]